MSFSSFFAGLSGLQANSDRLSVIGNNLANVNTVGFKASRVTFQDIFTSEGASFNGAGNPLQVGRGTQIGGIDSVFSQGSLQSTNVLTDMSIQGEGFFVLRDPSGELSYSRAGNFSFDADGFMTAPSGQVVQGFTTPDANGNIPVSGAANDIQIPSGLTASPRATTSFNGFINLNAVAQVDDPATSTVEQAEVFSTSVNIYDSLGTRHTVTLNFTPVDTTVPADGVLDQWSYEVTVPGEDVTGGTAGTPSVVGTGTIDFDANGQLATPATNITLNFPAWSNGAAAQNVEWEMFDANGGGILTGFAGPSSLSSSNQDGFGVGLLRTLTIDSDGLISGLFTNGSSVELARVVLGTFNNTNGLLRDGANGFLETSNAGLATIGAPNSGGRGVVTANTLELSNVDITKEFTNLIISQRGYQANSRIITTTDEITQEALTLKR